jgi:hypothetical protein
MVLLLFIHQLKIIMKAAVFHKPGDIRVDTVDDPQIEDQGMLF